MPGEFRRVADIATGQHGAITARQLGAAGVSPSGLRRRVQSGVLERIGTRTYRSPLLPASALADLATLVVDCGADARASGPTAAALHGFDGFGLRPPFHVVVPRGRNVQRARHRIHTTSDLPLIDRATIDGIPALSATRTLIDLARFVDERALTAALDSALRDGLTAEARPPPPDCRPALERPLRHPQAARRHRRRRGHPRRAQLAGATVSSSSARTPA